MNKRKKELVLLNFEGPVLKAVKTESGFLIIDEYGTQLTVLTYDKLMLFFRSVLSIMDSKDRIWKYSEHTDDAKPSVETIEAFLSDTLAPQTSGHSKIKEGLKKSIEGKAHFVQHFKNGGTVEDFKPLEPKQETLEEAAKRQDHTLSVEYCAFIEGAKWQAERMYSEEEVLELLLSRPGPYLTDEEIKEWFEQFKKK
jgi:hypothetical protein